ncbi:hypothetical protein ACTHQ2_23740, partial [Bacillus subtilis]|uniref:hypothetical protein n=1 Tax=Bacillus subtilis TaxID=1423 RepID=UPI003F7C548C
TIDAVSEAAQSKGWEFVDSLWPFIVLGAFFMVGKDYMQGSYAVMLRRLMVFALSLTVLSAAFGMSSSTVSKSLTASLDFSDWLSTKFMQVFSGQGSNGKDSNIYTSVWEQMADRPLEAGEFGELNIKITAEDAVKINKAIEPYQVVAGMKWVDALLWFAPDTDERADIIDIYADNYEAKYESAKNPYSRLMISVISLLSSVLSALFLLMIGGIMIAMVMYFIALIMSGIIIL